MGLGEEPDESGVTVLDARRIRVLGRQAVVDRADDAPEARGERVAAIGPAAPVDVACLSSSAPGHTGLGPLFAAVVKVLCYVIDGNYKLKNVNCKIQIGADAGPSRCLVSICIFHFTICNLQ